MLLDSEFHMDGGINLEADIHDSVSENDEHESPSSSIIPSRGE